MKLEDKAVEAIDKILATSESALSFITEQSPEIVRQILIYDMIYNLAALFMSIVVIACSAKFLLDVKNKKGYVMSCSECYYDWVFPVSVVLTGSSLVSMLTAFDSISSVIKIYLVPNIYILEYAAGLIK